MFKLITPYINHFRANAGFRRYFENTSWIFAEHFLRMLAALFVTVWIARYLGPEKFGVFSYALAFVSIFSCLAKLGLDNIIIKDLVNDPDKDIIYLGTAFWLKLIAAFITILMVVLASFFTSNDYTTNIYILIISIGIVFQSFEVIDFYFQSRVMAKFISICKIFQLIISSLVKIYLVLTQAELFWFVIASVVDQAILALTLYWVYEYKNPRTFYFSFDIKVAINLLKSSWPLILGGFVAILQTRIDQVMIKEMLGSTEVGYYSSATRLIEAFAAIAMLLTSSLFPAIVNAKRISIDMYKSRLFNLYRLMMILFLIVATPIYLFGSQIVIFFYKEAYAPAGYLFSLLAIKLFFTNYSVVRNAYLMAENMVFFSMMTLIVGAIINILLNYFWIPHYHSVGAIWASITSLFVMIFLIDLTQVKTRENFKMIARSILIINFKR